ncbi:hypothetical protein RND81_01G050500 [Saponaria officinalis]|uniref:Uncharacterized protein n=1 Tax=Saponaria officinalis TaxID=3572 RepID=A0AAW1NCT8_SAPOF
MEWTFEENKLFENAIGELGLYNPNIFQNIGFRLPRRTNDQIKEHYDALLRDVKMIELGFYDEKLDDLYETTLNIQEGLTSQVSKVNQRIPRRRGTPWTQDEHEAFLKGLRRYGKGDWKSISRNCVRTKTPTQVASHAQKYYQKVQKFSRKQNSEDVRGFV